MKHTMNGKSSAEEGEMEEKSNTDKDSSLELVKEKYKKAVGGAYSVILANIEGYMKNTTNMRQIDMTALLGFFINTAGILRDIGRYEEKMYKDILAGYKLDKNSIDELKRYRDSIISEANSSLTAILNKYSVSVQLKSDQNEGDHMYA